MGRIVGIDWGMRRVGVAISDERRLLARALPTVMAGAGPGRTVEKVASALAPYADVEQIVIGLPLMLSGKEGEMAMHVKAFADALQPLMRVQLVLWDERLTSWGVEERLKECSLSRKKRAALSDALSAVSILQNYLDALRLRV